MIRLLTAGESHGPKITAILEGVPAGIPIPRDVIDEQLARRQMGYGSGGRMQIERDRVQITGGVVAGESTGAPISLEVENRDYANWREREIEPLTVPRPGHADLTAALKYGYRELRLGLEPGERAGDDDCGWRRGQFAARTWRNSASGLAATSGKLAPYGQHWNHRWMRQPT